MFRMSKEAGFGEMALFGVRVVERSDQGVVDDAVVALNESHVRKGSMSWRGRTFPRAPAESVALPPKDLNSA